MPPGLSMNRPGIVVLQHPRRWSLLSASKNTTCCWHHCSKFGTQFVNSSFGDFETWVQVLALLLICYDTGQNFWPCRVLISFSLTLNVKKGTFVISGTEIWENRYVSGCIFSKLGTTPPIELARSDAIWLWRLSHLKDTASTWLPVSRHWPLGSSHHVVRKLNLAQADMGTAHKKRK